MTKDQTDDHSAETWRNFPRLFQVVVAAILGGAAIMGWRFSQAPEIPDGLSETQYRMAANRWRLAAGRKPDHPETLMMAGELAVKRHHPNTALAAFGGVPDDNPL